MLGVLHGMPTRPCPVQKQYAFPFVVEKQYVFPFMGNHSKICNSLEGGRGAVLHRKVLPEIARPKNNAEIIVPQIKQYRNHCVGNFIRPAKKLIFL